MSKRRKNVTESHDGSVSYKKSVVLSVINLSTKEISGVASFNAGVSFFKRLFSKNYSHGVRLEYDQNKVYIDVFLNIYFGFSVNDVAFKVQENIKKSVESMTEFKVEVVNVHVLGVVFDPDQEAAIS